MTAKIHPDAKHVLATALTKLKTLLHLTSADIGDIIGVHRNTVTRFLKNGDIEPTSKEGELALLLIRVYRSLFALNGGDLKAIRHWLTTNNYHVEGIPLEIMKSVLGLARVVNYLDAIRGKV